MTEVNQKKVFGNSFNTLELEFLAKYCFFEISNLCWDQQNMGSEIITMTVPVTYIYQIQNHLDV